MVTMLDHMVLAAKSFLPYSLIVNGETTPNLDLYYGQNVSTSYLAYGNVKSVDCKIDAWPTRDVDLLCSVDLMAASRQNLEYAILRMSQLCYKYAYAREYSIWPTDTKSKRVRATMNGGDIDSLIITYAWATTYLIKKDGGFPYNYYTVMVQVPIFDNTLNITNFYYGFTGAAASSPGGTYYPIRVAMEDTTEWWTANLAQVYGGVQVKYYAENTTGLSSVSLGTQYELPLVDAALVTTLKANSSAVQYVGVQYGSTTGFTIYGHLSNPYQFPYVRIGYTVSNMPYFIALTGNPELWWDASMNVWRAKVYLTGKFQPNLEGVI